MPESLPTGRAFFGAWTARAGFVSVTGGSDATAVDPYFLRRASIGPNSIARCVQDSTQTGGESLFEAIETAVALEHLLGLHVELRRSIGAGRGPDFRAN